MTPYLPQPFTCHWCGGSKWEGVFIDGYPDRYARRCTYADCHAIEGSAPIAAPGRPLPDEWPEHVHDLIDTNINRVTDPDQWLRARLAWDGDPNYRDGDDDWLDVQHRNGWWWVRVNGVRLRIITHREVIEHDDALPRDR